MMTKERRQRNDERRQTNDKRTTIERQTNDKRTTNERQMNDKRTPNDERRRTNDDKGTTTKERRTTTNDERRRTNDERTTTNERRTTTNERQTNDKRTTNDERRTTNESSKFERTSFVVRRRRSSPSSSSSFVSVYGRFCTPYTAHQTASTHSRSVPTYHSVHCLMYVSITYISPDRTLYVHRANCTLPIWNVHQCFVWAPRWESVRSMWGVYIVYGVQRTLLEGIHCTFQIAHVTCTLRHYTVQTNRTYSL